MYKVFFNDRTIYISDQIPGFSGKEKDYVCSFLKREDLEPQLINYLKHDRNGDLYIYSPNTGNPFEVFKSCFRMIPAAGGLVRNERNEFLVIYRRGKWDLPKGKAETEEKPAETALREVMEECNLDHLSLEKFLTTTYHVYFLEENPVLKKTDWYMMHYSGTKEPYPSKHEDIEKTIWMRADRMDSLTGDIFPSIMDVFSAGLDVTS